MVNGPEQRLCRAPRQARARPTSRFRDNTHVISVATAHRLAQVGRRIDESSPMVDARLAGRQPRQHHRCRRWRIDGPSISIRKFSQEDRSRSTSWRRPAASRRRWRVVLKIAARSRLNILISGGTGSGKTTTAERHVADDRPRRAHLSPSRTRPSCSCSSRTWCAWRRGRPTSKARARSPARPGHERAAHASRPHHRRRGARRRGASTCCRR